MGSGASVGDGSFARAVKRGSRAMAAPLGFLLEQEEGRFRGENHLRRPKGSDGLQGRFAGKAHAA